MALSAVLKTLRNSLKVLQRDPDISANTIGDEELEATLRQEAQATRNQSMAGGPPQRGGQPSNFDDLQKMNQGGPNDPRRTAMRQGPPPGHPDYRGPPPGHPDYRGPPPGGMPPGQRGGPPPGHPQNRGPGGPPGQPVPQGQRGGQPGGTGNLFGNK